MSKPDLWIDMTDLKSWQGNPTGIQRTVYNLAKYFQKNESVRFFYFDPSMQKYFECELVTQAAAGAASLHTPKSTAGYRLARRLPAPVKDKLKRVHGRLRATTASRSDQAPVAPFATGDTILVLGGNWGDNERGFIEGLAALKSSKSLRIIHMVYDMIPCKYPNYYVPGSTLSYERYFSQLIKFADILPCISKSTQQDLDAYIADQKSEHKPQTVVFRLGEDVADRAKAAIRASLKARITMPFIISVGTIEGRKNHTLLYYTVKEAVSRQIALPQIIIVGRRGWMTDSIQHLIDNDRDTAGKLFIVDDATDAEVAWLYQYCLFAIYPSFYEGWGLPIAEAGHYGKLCLVSNTSSMPEVLGELVDYFSPFNTQECLEKVTHYANSPTDLHAKEEAIRNRRPWLWSDAYADFRARVFGDSIS